MSTLILGPDFRMPPQAVTEKLAFLGRTGSGKTYAAQKLAEQMHEARAQIVVLDPVGVWYGLRLASDGRRPGLPIPVLGGLRGDIPLEPTAGVLIANLVVDRGTSIILDVSQFESDADKARFAQAFADRFFFRKKAAPSAVHVFIEEAQEFVPQNPQREEARMLHAFTRLVKIGRNFGIGVSLISQRPQEVNKKVLNLAEVLFAFQLTGPQERKTIQGWIADKGLDEDIAGILPKLTVGHPHVWSPAWLKLSKVVAIGRKTTFDASSTPKLGVTASARVLSPIDLAKLKTEMAATIERARAEDPRELRRQVADLQAQLRRRAPAPAPVRRVEVPAVKLEQINRLARVCERMMGEGAKLARLAEGWSTQASHLFVVLQKLAAPMPTYATAPPQRSKSLTPNRAREILRVVGPAPGSRMPPDMSIGEEKILTAAAQYPTGVSQDTLAVLTGYKRSSRNAYLSRLRRRDLVTVDQGVVRATDAGLTALGDFTPLPSGPALLDYWRERLPDGERAILDVLVQAYPKAVDGSALDDKTGYKRSSRNAYLSRLKSRRLVTVQQGQATASGDLF